MASSGLFARRGDFEVYDLSEKDLISIMELAQRLGIDSTKPISKIKAYKEISPTNNIRVTIDFQPDKNYERSEGYISLNCNLTSNESWNCQSTRNWLLSTKSNSNLKVLAPEDFEQNINSYFQVLDLIIAELGTKTNNGEISEIKKHKSEYQIIFGNFDHGNCIDVFTVYKRIVNFDAMWVIKHNHSAEISQAICV